MRLLVIIFLLCAQQLQAATITHRTGVADTGALPNVTGSFTPAVGDLVVVIAAVSATTDSAPTCTSSAGTTFTLVATAQYSATTGRLYAFIANQFNEAATSRTITIGSTAGSGTVIFVCSVSGMSKTGANALRQSAKQDNQGAGGTPAPAFAVAAETGNPIIGAIVNSTSPAGVTPPASWTEPATTGDLGYTSPPTGAEHCIRDSGFTGTTVTWGSTSASAFGSMILELDATPDVFPQIF